MHAQHGKRPQEWGPPQCKYYVSVKHNDPTAQSKNLFNLKLQSEEMYFMFQGRLVMLV